MKYLRHTTKKLIFITIVCFARFLVIIFAHLGVVYCASEFSGGRGIIYGDNAFMVSSFICIIIVAVIVGHKYRSKTLKFAEVFTYWVSVTLSLLVDAAILTNRITNQSFSLFNIPNILIATLASAVIFWCVWGFVRRLTARESSKGGDGDAGASERTSIARNSINDVIADSPQFSRVPNPPHISSPKQIARKKLMQERLDDIRIAVIVALAEEYAVFQRYFQGRVVKKFHVGGFVVDVLERDDKSEKIGLLVINRMGNVAAGIAAARLLEVFNLDLVVNIGLAAGVKPDKQRLGDVIIAEKVRYYETGKLGQNDFSVAPEYSDLASRWLTALQTSGLINWPLGCSIDGAPRNVFFGTVASGEKVISRRDFVENLVSLDRTIVGIEMESYGISAAVHGRSEKLLLIRGICDFADAAKNDHARLSALDGTMRLFNEALRRGVLASASPSSIQIPRTKNYTLELDRSQLVNGVANDYIEVVRGAVDEFKYRKELIEKIANYGIGGIQRLCIQLRIDFDELRGHAKDEKAASMIDILEKKQIMSLDDLDELLSGAWI